MVVIVVSVFRTINLPTMSDFDDPVKAAWACANSLWCNNNGRISRASGHRSILSQ